MTLIRTILHPTDFSDCSRTAFRLAAILAREQGAKVVLLHVNPPLGPMVAYGEALAQLQPEEPHERFAALVRRLQETHPDLCLETRFAEGDAAPVILRAAQETNCDLIVMGTHGRTGLARLVMGSVAEQVSRKAPCPVLTVKAPRASVGFGQSAGSRYPEAVGANA